MPDEEEKYRTLGFTGNVGFTKVDYGRGCRKEYFLYVSTRVLLGEDLLPENQNIVSFELPISEEVYKNLRRRLEKAGKGARLVLGGRLELFASKDSVK